MTPQPPTMPPRLRWGLAVCAAISIAVHVLLLIGPPKSRLAADFRPAEYRTVEVRLVESKARPGPAAPSPAPVAQKKKAPALDAVQPDVPTTPAVSAPVPPELSEPSEFDSYLPRALLSEPAEALTEIVIAAPQEEEFPGRRVGILTLFIDEEGQVRHVAPDDILLPPALEQLARDAFMAGRFSPGRINGQPTKSRMRVEIVFE